MQLDANSAKIEFNDDGAKVDATPAGNVIHFHLTKGFSTTPGGKTNALFIKGSVNAQTTIAELETWHFGFIQLMELNEYRIVYIGRTPGDGQTTIRTSTGFLLDSGPSIKPWTSLVPAILTPASKIEADFGDHPSSKAANNITNQLTNAALFLYKFTDHRTVVSTFVAEDPQGNRQFLAHMIWIVNYDFRFKWRDGSPVKLENSSRFFNGISNLGLPADATVSALIKQPKPPFYNQHAHSEVLKAVRRGPPGRVDEDFRSDPTVPSDFFT